MRSKKPLTLVETPRDAWQGIKKFIPTETKVSYINTLLKVGFDIIEAGSFVSSKAIPQLSDTMQVINKIKPWSTKTKLMALVANEKYADDAMYHDQISILSYPYSISPEFLYRNLKTNQRDSLSTIERIHEKCVQNNREMIVYIAMAFGNPYDDPWNLEILSQAVETLSRFGIQRISFTDITGIARKETIAEVFDHLYYEYRHLNVGFHLHAGERDWEDKLQAAYINRCRMFDSAMLGYGGCPMTNKELVGNIDTVRLIGYFQQKGEEVTTINYDALREAEQHAGRIFQNYM
jgi:hydroxymethylglutaryl-CoA lyase